MTLLPSNGNMSKDPSGMSERAGKASTAELQLFALISTTTPSLLPKITFMSLSSVQFGNWVRLNWEKLILVGSRRT